MTRLVCMPPPAHATVGEGKGANGVRQRGGVADGSTGGQESPKVHAMARPLSLILALALAVAAAFAGTSCESYPTFAVEDAGPDRASPVDGGTRNDAALGPLESTPPAEIPPA